MTKSIDRDRRDRARTAAPEDGGTTQDLRTRVTGGEQPAPVALSAIEQKLRTRGLWMIITGTALTVLTIAIAIVWHVGFGTDMPLAIVLPLYAASFGAVYLGCMEYLSRHTRGNHAEALARMDQIEHGLKLLVDSLPEQMQQRWYAGYARGHQDSAGARTGTDSSTRVTGSADVLRMRPRA